MATGRDLFGLKVDKCVAVFVSLEDGMAVVRHRLSLVCRTLAIDPRELEGRLHIVDGTDHPELFSAEGRGLGATTPTFAEMRSLVRSVGAGLVVVDNASDAFGADEIQRRPVRAFIRSLVDIAKESKAAVLLLAHVDKTTSRARKSEDGEGYSGSTAWHNSARSRLFLTRAADGALTLEHQKSNFGKLQEPLKLRWADGGLPAADYQSNFLAPGARLEGHGSDEKAAGLLRVLAEYESRQQYCSPVATARNNVFSMLKSEPAFQTLKLGADKCRQIVNQCQREKWIEVVQYRTHDRKTRERWTITAEGREFAGLSAPSAPCAPSSEESAESATGAPSAPSCVGGVGEMGMGDDRARARWGEDGPAIVKATIDALTRADIDPAARAFLSLAMERSVLGRLLGLRRVPFDVRVLAVASGALGHFVAEAAPVPLSRPVLEGSTLKPATVAGIVVATKESIENPSAETLVQEDLLNAVAGVLDIAFLSADPGVVGERPAGIAHDAPSIAATGNLADDLAALMEIYGGDLLTTAFVTTPAVALRLALAAGGNPQIDLGPNGGRLFGVPTFTSRHVVPTSNGSPLLMVDAGGIVANWDSIDLSQSGHTSLVMADNPTAPAEVVSMFQTNSVAFKATVHAAWNVARSGSVAILEGL